MKGEQLETILVANKHAPEVQQKAQRELEALLVQMDLPDAPDMPGKKRMEDDRERIRKTQEEILFNAARNVGAHIRHLGPLALDRLRRLPPGPDGNAVRRTTNPNFYRVAPAR